MGRRPSPKHSPQQTDTDPGAGQNPAAPSGAIHHPPYLGFVDARPDVEQSEQPSKKVAKENLIMPKRHGMEDKKRDYIDFLVTKMNLSKEFASANFDRELAPRIAADLNQEVIDKLTRETFSNRPKGEDAIGYYTRVWSDLIGQGRAFSDDIEDFDYPLLRGIINRISLLARTQGGEPSDYYPPNYPPTRRPEPELNEIRQKEREANRRASARYAQNLRNPK